MFHGNLRSDATNHFAWQRHTLANKNSIALTRSIIFRGSVMSPSRTDGSAALAEMANPGERTISRNPSSQNASHKHQWKASSQPRTLSLSSLLSTSPKSPHPSTLSSPPRPMLPNWSCQNHRARGKLPSLCRHRPSTLITVPQAPSVRLRIRNLI